VASGALHAAEHLERHRGTGALSRGARSRLTTLQALLTGAGTLSLAGLIRFEFNGQYRRAILAKGLASLGFLAVALVGGPRSAVDYLVVAGLVACLAGDVLLSLPGQRGLLAGLTAFLVGHLFYLAAFAGLESPIRLPPMVVAVPTTVSVVVLGWLWPRLNGMRLPVTLYVTAITAMLLGAIAVASATPPTAGGMTLALGAGAFYLSDFFVARQSFVRRGIENSFLGLPLYYLGQYLIASAVGVLG
jgi:uncharacterized membrane protein YhhN